MTWQTADTIDRIKFTAARHEALVDEMYRSFPPFKFQRKRYEFLRTRKAILEHGLAHLGASLNTMIHDC
jgi:hypothetical protein